MAGPRSERREEFRKSQTVGQCGVVWIAIALVVFVLVAAAYSVHRLALYAEDRGWIYYKTKRPGPTPWLGSLEGIYQPSMQHVVDEIVSEEIRADQDESGAGEPDTGS